MTESCDDKAPFGPSGESPMDRALCRRLLDIALENGGDYAELFFEYRAGGGFSFSDDTLKAVSRGVSMGVGVRVQRQGVTGFASSEDLSFKALERAAKTASQIAVGGGGKRAFALESPPIPRRYEVEAASLDAPLREKRLLCERAASAALSFDPRVIAAESTFSEEVREILVATSDGIFAHDVQPLFRVGVRVRAEDHRSWREGSSGGGGRVGLGYFRDRPPEWHGREAARQAVQLLDCRQGPTGDVVVVWGSADCGIIFQQAVAQSLEADYILAGTSGLAGLMGRQIANDFFTLIDDASVPGSRGSLNVDDEGIVPHQTVLIEEGRVCGHLHDRRSARLLGHSTTGNGRRESFGTTPMPRCTNTLVLPGPHEPEEILRSVKRGILVMKLGGGQIDMSNGDFVFGMTESYLIEDGTVTAPLAPQNILGNVIEMLGNVTMLGSDVFLSDGIWTSGKHNQSVPVGVGCPVMRVESLFIAS
ncbi:TldD/PmbA family protein [Polyangium fumosum]|uniref:TldD/PmbA family protein n=1 Tax=Polyangium fumosum TaxID=889272 RepID=A0A4V5PSG6_9BACT|nr:TldD/PmbA family protein [Polyangium fumosum]TKD09156.1 TldD/PmbA family protein [Polyangium fumosum]